MEGRRGPSIVEALNEILGISDADNFEFRAVSSSSTVLLFFPLVCIAANKFKPFIQPHIIRTSTMKILHLSSSNLLVP